MVMTTNNSAVNSESRKSAAGVETRLQSCLQEQSSVFEYAVQVIERLEIAASRRELGSADSVGQLQKALELVVAAQQKVAAVYSQFTQSNAALSTELRVALGRHEELLKSLITRIDHLQKIFESVRSDLIPQIDSESRRRLMQAAYQQSLKTV